MWLCSSITWMSWERSAAMTGLTWSAVIAKSPLIATFPPPSGWNINSVDASI